MIFKSRFFFETLFCSLNELRRACKVGFAGAIRISLIRRDRVSFSMLPLKLIIAFSENFLFAITSKKAVESIELG